MLCQVAIEFGVAGGLCIVIFASSSFLVYGLFSEQFNDEPKTRS